MYKGIYITLSGAVLKQKNLDITAQNIANADISGYKKEQMSFKDYIIPVDNKAAKADDGRVMTELSRVSIDFTEGPIKGTGNPLDLAINGEGFFALDEGMYTRNGSFMISDEGYLTTKSGVKLLGESGPIEIQGSDIDISPSGEIIVDAIPVGKLKIVDFPDKEKLKKLNGGMFAAGEAGVTVNSSVSQGFLEQSNVNVIQEMVGMIASTREFESYQKMIHAFDEAASKAINEMGK
ncbi:MAG: flagellar basal-body rod protein FlgF [Nitrospirae bacterium]|nr:flagellar basal-body rod protein FlgF [Nitrospirota bacterium]